MIRILLFAAFYFCATFGYAQVPTISPLLTGEYCPNTTITFTVTLTGNTPSVIPKALNAAPSVIGATYNIQTSNGVTTFNFDGRFTDVNTKQTFQINYKYGPNNRDTTKDFTFIKIKSLATPGTGAPNDCSAIQPTPTSILAPRCQTGTVAISFTNIQYSNVFESPVVCYGTVSNYEYLLPAGWQIGTSTSNGSTWLPGGNSVTVTYDASTGDGGSVKVRPINTACGTNLEKGRESIIPISRPAPSLSITGQDFICNVADQSTFTLNGLPTGATVAWSVSLPGQVQVVGCATCPSVTLEKIGSASTTATLTATVTHCSFTYTESKTIKLGPPAGVGIVGYNNLNPCTTDASFTVLTAPPLSVYKYSGNLTVGATGFANSLTWSLKPGTVLNGWTFTYSGGTVTVGTKQTNTAVTLRATATNDCGSAYKDYRFWSGDCLEESRVAAPTSGYSLYPNPTKGVFTITLASKEKEAVIKEVVVKNKMGITVRQLKYNTGQKAQTINLQDLPPDIYLVNIFDGKVWIGKRLFKE